MRWHWQNLTAEKPGCDDAFPWHGRGWLAPGGMSAATIGVEWCLLAAARHAGIGITFDGEGGDDDVMVSFGLPLVASLYLSVSGWGWLRRVIPKRRRETSLRAFDGGLWWEVWRDSDEWQRGTPKWRSGSFHPLDFVFGDAKYESATIETRDVVVPMPERGYRGVATRSIATWRRPRWPWWPLSVRVERVGVKMAKGEQIPTPGKGENSCDCGDTATFSHTCPASSIEDGIGSLVAATLSWRRRYGGQSWTPSENADAA